jgi:DNA-binding CsgD family transcriptional regulator
VNQAHILRGRDAELAVIHESLRAARSGRGGVVLVEGESGFGKSQLLADASAMAFDFGVRACSGTVSPDRLVPMSPVLEALFEGSPPVLAADALPDLRLHPAERYWLLQDLEARLEEVALEGPVLVCLDDLQWGDAGCCSAVRALPIRLSSVPIVWLLAYRADRVPGDMRAAFDRLKETGARTLRLDRLDAAAVSQVVADIVGAAPDATLLELAEGAKGNPFLLVELLHGLVEEGLVRIDGSDALLLQARLPRRVRNSMRDRLTAMSAITRRAVEAASVLGQRFSVGQLAAMLDSRPALLLQPVDDLLGADLFAEDDEDLTFRHALIREAVLDTLPASIRRALQRQAVDVLLASGTSPLEVAPQLAASAEPGDSAAIATLYRAVRALGSSDPGLAADLGLATIELVALDEPVRGPLVAETALLIHAAGRVVEGRQFVDTVLRTTVPPEQEAEVRLGIAGMLSLSGDLRAESSRIALALPNLSETMRARHLARLVANLTGAGRPEEARQWKATAEAAANTAGDQGSKFTLALAQAGLVYLEGDFAAAQRQVETAIRIGTATNDKTRRVLAEQWRCEILRTRDLRDEARLVAEAGRAAAERDRHAWAARHWGWATGRQLLDAGQLSDAAAVLEGLFAVEEGQEFVTLLDASAVLALGEAALHMGNDAQAGFCAAVARRMIEIGVPEVRRQAYWLLALQEMSRSGASAAREQLIAASGGDPVSVVPTFSIDAVDPIRIVRIALAVGDSGLADEGLALASRRARKSPGIPSVVAALAQARGLIEGDSSPLAEAAAGFQSVARPLARASALEDLGRVLVSQGRRGDGVEQFGRALQAYGDCGASWDAARVRRRLRVLGVRRRLARRQATDGAGDALTASEQTVADLVAQGLTNRQVAERLFVSPHTVSMHLRHVFTKLSINSRIELIRAAGPQEPADE